MATPADVIKELARKGHLDLAHQGKSIVIGGKTLELPRNSTKQRAPDLAVWAERQLAKIASRTPVAPVTPVATEVATVVETEVVTEVVAPAVEPVEAPVEAADADASEQEPKKRGRKKKSEETAEATEVEGE